MCFLNVPRLGSDWVVLRVVWVILRGIFLRVRNLAGSIGL